MKFRSLFIKSESDGRKEYKLANFSVFFWSFLMSSRLIQVFLRPLDGVYVRHPGSDSQSHNALRIARQQQKNATYIFTSCLYY